MDLNRIRLFVRVVETGSFTAAARIVGLPKSSVSRGVTALERELGVRLLQRTTRRLHLTEAGRAYYETVSRALSGVEEAAAAVSQLQDEPRGAVRLTAPVDLGNWLLAPILTRFAARYREVRLDVSLTQRMVDLVREGFDLALRVGKLADTALVARPLGPVRAGLFASPRYLKRKGSPRSVSELADHDCVLFRSGGRATWSLVGPAGRQKVEARGTVSVDDHQFVREAAMAGLGVTLLPLFACSGPFRTNALVRVLPDHATVGEPLQLVYPSARFLPKRVALLRDQLLEELPPRLEV